MPSTYSNLGIQLMATGENAGTWGTYTNTNLSLIDNSVNGYESIPVTSTSFDIDVPNISGSPGVAQNRVLLFTNSGANPTGTANIRITKNGSATSYYEGWYFVTNSTGQTINVYQGTTYVPANSVTILNGKDAIIYCDGSGNVKQYFLNPTTTTIAASGNASVGGDLAVTGNAAVNRAAVAGVGLVCASDDNTTSTLSFRAYDSSGNIAFQIYGDKQTYFYGGINLSTSDTSPFNITLNDDSATGINFQLIKNTASPAAGDDCGLLRFYSKNSAAATTEYGRITCQSDDVTNGSEDGSLYFYTQKAGVFTTKLVLDSTYGIRTPEVYNNSISGRDVFVTSNGELGYNSSSIKTKLDVVNSPYGLDYVLQLRPVLYRHYKEPEGSIKKGGFIAEEVDALGLKEFVQYEKDGAPAGLDYGQMVSLLTKAIQEQQAMIEDLKARVAALGG